MASVLASNGTSSAIGAATALAGLLAAVLGIFKYFDYRSNRDRKAAVGQAFSAVVTGLAGTDKVERLASALLLRRFFSGTSEYAKPNMPYADDAIGVIAATLRDEPTGNVQKVLADGLAYVETQDDGRDRRWARSNTYKQGLTHRDFQRGNYRNAYLSLEGPAGHRRDSRMNLSDSDFFGADLSNASLKRDICARTAFYECIAVSTVFSKADLTDANFTRADVRNADFRDADLKGANFEGAKLAGADFRGAVLAGTDDDSEKRANFKDCVGLPSEITSKLVNDVFMGTPGEPIAMADSEHSVNHKRVFLSVASVTTSAHRALIELVSSVLRDEGLDVVRTNRDDYHRERHLLEVREAMASCSGVIAVGLPQLLVRDGVWRQATSDERPVVDQYLPTPWNDIEAGMAVGLKLPVLALQAGCSKCGIFDLGTGDFGFERMELSGGWATDELRESMKAWARTALGD